MQEHALVLRSVRNVSVQGKRVVLRAGLNVPTDKNGKVADSFRLKRALMTLEHLSKSGARTIIVAHFGRSGDSIERVHEALSGMTSVPIGFFRGSLEEAKAQVEALKDGDCLMLENIRREAGEEQNSPELAKRLAALGELFVNDAFADSHRAHASIVGVAALLPSYAGLLLEEEVEKLSSALTPPPGSLALIGGAKFETKQPVIEKLLPLYQEVCVGGAIANDLLKARGFSVGLSLVSATPVPDSLVRNPHVLTGNDAAVTDGTSVRQTPIEGVHIEEEIMDVGLETACQWAELIKKSPFVLWNGPMGVYEKGFVGATDTLARALAASSTRAAVGGGDTLATLEKISFDESRIFRSTGGGAMLEFLAQGTLPGIEPLRA